MAYLPHSLSSNFHNFQHLEHPIPAKMMSATCKFLSLIYAACVFCSTYEVYFHYGGRECTFSTSFIGADISAVIMHLHPCQIARLTNSTQNTERPLSNQLDLRYMHRVNPPWTPVDEWYARGIFFLCGSGTAVQRCNKSREGEYFHEMVSGVYTYQPMYILKFRYNMFKKKTKKQKSNLETGLIELFPKVALQHQFCTLYLWMR